MPWMGYFKKIQTADQFVLLDHVAFSRGSYTNRVRIHSTDGLGNQWLTIPIKKHALGTPISEIEIDRSNDIEDYLLSKIHNTYQESPGFKGLFPKIKEQAELLASIDLLSQYNIEWINFICKELGIQTAMLLSSSLEFEESKDQVVLQICNHLDATSYISGMGGKNYLDDKAFSDIGIDVEYSDFVALCNQEKIDDSLIGNSSISWLFSNQKII